MNFFHNCYAGSRMKSTIREEQEYNVKNNKNWKYVSKTDTKSMWKLIDYHKMQHTTQRNVILNQN